MFENPSDDRIRDILSRPRRVAVVGCSPDPTRASHRVARQLIAWGHTVFPVNPTVRETFGQRSYASLAEVPPPLEMVDVFRRADAAGQVVDEAIAAGAKIVWMQLGVIDDAAAERARAAGLTVVMDRCPLIEHRRLF